jgi:hypothetical protein
MPAPRSKLQLADRTLIKELERRLRCRQGKGEWRNAGLAKRRTLVRSLPGLERLQRSLEQGGGFAIQIEKKRWRDTDGERRSFTLARAASTDMWPMGTNYWVRDNAIIGARYLFADDRSYRKVGKELLLSALTFMSSKAQLARCEGIIRSSSAAFRRDPGNWPYIFASINDNLNAAQEEKWAHKQDAWQIAVFYILEAIEAGLLSPRDLTKKHRNFVGMVIPFLAKVSFWTCENSGSWEELPAVRTSVRAWEHRLIVKLVKAAGAKEFSFITRGFLKYRRYLSGTLRADSLDAAVSYMERRVMREMVADLPGESPRYRGSDPRYRYADAALIYLLLIEYPSFLATRLGKDPEWADRLEKKIFATIASLEDTHTGAIRRYKGDSYQRTGYFRHLTIKRLNAIYGAPSGDASAHFAARNRAVPVGRGAAWTHFVWQLAAWSGRRYLETGSPRYRQIHERYFEQGLGLFTGPGEASIEQDSSGKPRVIRVAPLRMPECYISEKSDAGKILVFPSPHTPLNWAVVEMFNAFEVRRALLSAEHSVKRSSKKTLIGA